VSSHRRKDPLFPRLAAWCLAAVALPALASHGLILGIDEGFEVCNNTFNVVGAASGGCQIVDGNAAINQSGGSYFWMDLNLDGNFGDANDAGEILALYVGPDGGIWVGDEQIANGTHAGVPDAFGGSGGSENPHLDSPFYFFGNTGMFYTDVGTGQGGITSYGVPVSFITNDGTSATMDFTSWRATWYGGAPTYHDLSGQLTGDSGIAQVDCTPKPCAAGSTYVLDYAAHLPSGDPFAGILWTMHIEGSVYTLFDITPPSEVANTGSTVDHAGIDTISSTELSYSDDTDPAANIAFTVTAGPANGQLELTTAPGVAITAFTQDDIDNNRLVYVHDGSLTDSDGFTFDVSDSIPNTSSGNTFNLTIGLATISTQPQDVKAAVEWVPAKLANTPSASFTPMQVTLAGDINTGDVIRVDLPARGNRRIISDTGTGTGAAFADPRAVVLDEASNRAIVSDHNLPGLVAVDLATGNRTVFSRNGVAGSGPAFTSPGRLRLDAASSRILVSDTIAIIAVDLASGDRSILSDNSGSFGTGPAFQQIRGVAVDAANNRLLVADENINALLAVDPSTGNRSVFSDTTHGAGTSFSVLRDVVIDVPNNRALVSDLGLDAIFAVNLTTGDRTVISRFSTSTGTGPDFGDPTHLALDQPNRRLLVSAYQQFAVFAMDLATGDRTIISDNATHAGPGFVRQRGIVLQPDRDRALVVDTDARALLAVDLAPEAGELSILSAANSGIGTGPNLDFPAGLAVDQRNDRALVIERAIPGNDKVVAVNLVTGDRTTLSGNGTGSGPVMTQPIEIVLDRAGDTAYVLDRPANDGAVYSVDIATGDRTVISDNHGTGSGPGLVLPFFAILDEENGRLLLTDERSGSDGAVVAVDLVTGDRTEVSGNSVGTGASFQEPRGIVNDATHNRWLVLDKVAGAVVSVDPLTGNRTVFSDASTGTGPTFADPSDIALGPAGDYLYVVDWTLQAVIRVDLQTGDRSIFHDAGSGSDLNAVLAVELDESRSRLLITDLGIDGIFSVDLYDPKFGSALPAAPFTGLSSANYSLTAGGAGEAFAGWTWTGGTVAGPTTLTFTDMPVELTGAPVGRVTDYTFTLKDAGGNNLKATPQLSGPAFTMVNAITATVTPSVDTLDATQGSRYFTDGTGDAIASDIFIELDNNATLNTLGEGELAIRLRGDFTGISKVAASIESGVFRAETATSGNFTILDYNQPIANLFGGTNDVTASWDGTLNTSETDTNFNLTIASTSNAKFFGYSWMVHHARMYGPGTYVFDSDCTGTDLDGGNNSCGDGPYTTLTVGAGQVGAHMLFDWGGATDIHVAMVWDVGSASDFESGGSGALWTGAAGSASPGQLYQLISRDGDADGTQGIAMVSGPFAGFSLNFNLDLFAGDGAADELSLPPGPGVASAFLIGGFDEETSKNFHLRFELDGTTVQSPRDFTAAVDVLTSPAIQAPASDIVGPVTAATFGTNDSDGDGLADSVESTLGTDPNNPDSDGDGLTDFYEVNIDLDPSGYTAGTDYDPNNPDTDGDGFWDGAEVQFGSNPLDAGSVPVGTIRVSTDSAGGENNGTGAFAALNPRISGNGRYAVFYSNAGNLVADDTNGFGDIFVKDIRTGVTVRASTDSAGNEGNADAGVSPGISDDGRYVVFTSTASNLVPGDTGFTDVFVKDMQTGSIALVSTDSTGTAGNNISLNGVISADGRFVAFRSQATNLVANDSNGTDDVFVKDTQTGTTARISTDSSGVEGNDFSEVNAISADGRYVAFASDATNLVAGDSNGQTDVFVKDTQTGITTRVSTDSAGAQATGGASSKGDVSADGRYVTFTSAAVNLVAGDTNGQNDVFVKDTWTGATTRVSTDSAGSQAQGEWSGISADGRYVTFRSNASSLVANDTNGVYDAFVKDTQTGVTTRVSTDSAGNEGNGDSGSFTQPAISSDGGHVVFDSVATNLVAGDTNGVRDIFRAGNPSFSPDTDGDGLRDDIEAILGTDPNDPDSDGDGLTDFYEVNIDLDPSGYTMGTDYDPNNPDTDGDGFFDGGEVQFGSDPLSAASVPGSPLRISTDSAGHAGRALCPVRLRCDQSRSR